MVFWWFSGGVFWALLCFSVLGGFLVLLCSCGFLLVFLLFSAGFLDGFLWCFGVVLALCCFVVEFLVVFWWLCVLVIFLFFLVVNLTISCGFLFFFSGFVLLS